MVVLHHNELDRTLWGPASTTGRSRATDFAIYIQLAVVTLLGVTCALDYDKPEAVRSAAAGATLLMYFRSTGLFSTATSSSRLSVSQEVAKFSLYRRLSWCCTASGSGTRSASCLQSSGRELSGLESE
ncbi:hypothetical protein PC129_g96 [Phytophthora cactorum]|uniref:Uncharacterized protein n=1 Tax=Phytophthora cactorum TaxID=29920 RepID=A0A8T1GZJ4_9STRA|nr:hypothetical protein Pcac1_g21850 [Phytophthora cactorum]KAG2848874.1 hypothetical protein PC112_g478 [Phytophthora cactorum]KAG2849075.1 hypothetical protein PC111_g129 [Phytophthora cactorum]KAG2868997.1 hypothetical protein PC113_g562 [Phytophthora cactorum]KAG2934681.1 hypothetical protein PC114_g849 [Phytophthora cactorum]